MDVSQYLSEASFWTPLHCPSPLDLSLFSPIWNWSVDAIRPRHLVQLGVHPFSPYLHLCEAVKRLELATRCTVLDAPSMLSASRRDEAVHRRALEDHRLAFGDVSKLVESPAENLVGPFDDHSIDLLMLAEGDGVAAFERDLDAWLAKLSERAVVLLPKTGVDGSGQGSSRLLQKLTLRHQSFEFTHGDGLALVAIGTSIPEGLRPLLEASKVPPHRDAIRLVYERLGRSLFDALGRRPDGATTVEHRGEDLALRRLISELCEENAFLDQRRRELGDENLLFRQENPLLLHNFNDYRHRHDVLLHQHNLMLYSFGWRMIEKGRELRARHFPEDRLRGRCLRLAMKFARHVETDGPRSALHKASRRVARKLKAAIRRPGTDAVGVPAPAQPAIPAAPHGASFEDLPWIYTGSRSLDGARVRPTFKILLIGHTACRTGAPLCLLRISEELSKLPDVECWTFVRSRGELTDAFARHAPTLDAQQLCDAHLAWEDAPRLIASRFREFSGTGVAICNTMAVSEYHAALAAEGVPILSWVHELPTFIDILGGDTALERIRAASRMTIVPADVVRDALVRRFSIEPTSIKTLRYGIEARTLGLSSDPMRSRVREELGLPADALIVVGCGTIDLRKGADLFVQTARRFLSDPVTSSLADRTWFLWFGHPSDPELRKWLIHDVESAGLSDRIRFLGTRKDMTPYFLGADVFALTSREDPCPFANLEAMESALAVVAFAGSGGAPEVLGESGVVVPYLDTHAMALGIGRLLADDAARAEMGRVGRATIRRDFTWPRFMEDLLGIFRSEYDYRPTRNLKVSVIVPNYHHAPYLEERLSSVFEQTLHPHEIIFLDDASHDGSVEVAERLAASSPVPMRIVVNERNSGSTFKQWLKGLEMATGDLIWIAESDDRCLPEFLERLVPEFQDPDVVLAFCQSALIGANGEILAKDFHEHVDDLSLGRWRSGYTCDAATEAELALSQKNTIPNASAVVFRHVGRLDFAEELAGMRFAGDWLFYAMRIRGRKIAYAPEVLNHYRRHEQTVSHQAVRADTHAEETLHVKARIFETYPVSTNAIARSLGQTASEYNMLTDVFGLKRPPLTENERAAPALSRIREILAERADGPADLKILMVIDAAEPSAGVAPMLRLAGALSRDHQVFLCCAAPLDDQDDLKASIDDRVVLLEGTLGATPWSVVDPFGRQRIGILRELIRFHRVEVIHSRSPRADRLVLELNSDLNIPWFIEGDESGEDWPDEAKADVALETVAGVFHATDEPWKLAELRPALAGKRWIRTDDESHGHRSRAVYIEAYTQARRAPGLSPEILSIRDRLQGFASRESA